MCGDGQEEHALLWMGRVEQEAGRRVGLCCKNARGNTMSVKHHLFVQLKQSLQTAWQPMQLGLSHLLCLSLVFVLSL